MSKRFTETDKWTDAWFRKLKPPSKLLFLFMVDKCDLAGFIEEDYELWAFTTGMDDKTILAAIEGLDRAIEYNDGWYWVKGFLKHQKNLPLNSLNNAHKHIITLLKEKQPLFPSIKGLISPIGKGIGKGKGKGIGKGKNIRVKKNTQLMNRVGEWFARKDTTLWLTKEADSLNALGDLPEDELLPMQFYYEAYIDKDKDYRRRDIITLLNNWTGELDRAMEFCGLNKRKYDNWKEKNNG